MANQGKQQIIQVAAFLRGTIQGLVWAQALPEELISSFGDVMAQSQSRPPVGELLPFNGIGSHDSSIKAETCGHGTNH